MIYKVGMICKHFKGKDLYEKNIYRIEQLNVLGKDIDQEKVKYTGDGVLEEAEDLIIYSNIFQNNRTFAREYSDISSVLDDEKQKQYNQTYKVEPLTEDELELITTSAFKKKKRDYVRKKYGE